MWKKIVLGIVMTVIIVISVYFTYFHHPPPADILAANKARRAHPKDVSCCCGGGGGADYDDDDDEDVSPQKEAKRRWEKFMDKQDLVSVGEIYTKCEGDDRVMIGQVAMLPDPSTGGVMTRTFVNVTLENDITGGEVRVVSEYNGKELYNSKWELCSAEEGLPEPHIIFCPISAGKKSYVKDLPIPSYLPKGRFFSRAWVLDTEENTLGCSLSEFTI